MKDKNQWNPKAPPWPFQMAVRSQDFGEPPQLDHPALAKPSYKPGGGHGGVGDLRGLNCFRAVRSVYFECWMYVSFKLYVIIWLLKKGSASGYWSYSWKSKLHLITALYDTSFFHTLWILKILLPHCQFQPNFPNQQQNQNLSSQRTLRWKNKNSVRHHLLGAGACERRGERINLP